ncbi:MAG: DUF305 domain-containing protein [Actinomycetota bacterium]|nr:DUF305 domain-containing protein [Actinomycetota bacterium]MDA3019768.1 DUF305 domain-containing protein [Actinomycetota bacterium]
MSHKNRITAALVTGVLLVTACGGESHNMSDMSTDSTETDATGSESSFNDADVMFAQMMIPHHEQAIELADMALDPTLMAGEQVKTLAAQIKSAQDPEIDLMTQWLTDWDRPLMDMSEEHDMSMDGMLSVDEIAALGELTGAEFDQAWAASMIAHHKGAIKMAETVKEDGKSTPVKDLANLIMQEQQSEITVLETLLD